jgi:aspartate aminotransferase/aminotransferase
VTLETPPEAARDPVRITALGRSGIREIMDLASTLDGVIHLELGEPDFPTPPHVVEAITPWLATGAVKYTLSRGMPVLREALAAKVAARNGIAATAEDIVVTPGATTAVLMTLLACVQPGESVLIPAIGWPSYAIAVGLAGGRAVRYPLLADDGYEPDLAALEDLARGARLLIVNSPSNPTGAVYRPATMQALVELAQRHDLLVLSDEVYEDVIFDGAHSSPAAYDDTRVVSTFSFSKGYAMTGWRVGYAAGPRALIETMVHVQEAVVACTSELAQRAALAALTGPQEVVAEMRDRYRERRDLVSDPLRRAGMLARKPSGAFYAILNLGDRYDDTYAAARELLLHHRVGVAPGETFGPAGRGLVRISLASATSDLVEGVDRIVRACGEAPGTNQKEA